jgi:hypothetical protein
MAILDAIKSTLFAESADPGKVCQIVYKKGDSTGAATLLVPEAAYNRYARRACLRALKLKIPEATKITRIKSAHGTVKYPTIDYHLVRVEFTTK